jgi:hypothetical protein
MVMEARIGDGHGMRGDEASEERLERDGGGQTVEESWRKSRSATARKAALRRRSASRVTMEGEARWEASSGILDGRLSVGIFSFFFFFIWHLLGGDKCVEENSPTVLPCLYAQPPTALHAIRSFHFEIIFKP